MSYSKMADDIIQLADGLGYGLDIRFNPITSPKKKMRPIVLTTTTGKRYSFDTFESALHFLETRKASITS